MTTPAPPLPKKKRRFLTIGCLSLLAALVLFPVLAGVALLSAFGLIRTYAVPSNGMAPELKARDHLVAEGLTLFARKPRRGDVIIFRTDEIPGLREKTIYAQRVVGEPGDRLRFEGDKLFVNGEETEMRNSEGPIKYIWPSVSPNFGRPWEQEVPRGFYFTVGDNSANSMDSRSFGPFPAKNVVGRAVFRYWPLSRIGGIE